MRRSGNLNPLPSEEPARWLVMGEEARMVIEARIRGLWTIDECREWLEFETSHQSRRWVVAALNKRIDEIKELPYSDPEEPLPDYIPE